MAQRILSEEFRRMQKLAGLINEEQFHQLNEATLINKGQSSGVEKPIGVDDLIYWSLTDYSNDRGMGGTYAGTAIGKIVKILGTKNISAEVISPSNEVGNIYKVGKQELKRVPKEGENIVATVSYDSGAGSGSQGKDIIKGTVISVNTQNASIKLKTEEGKDISLKLENLSNIKTI
jgi:hypothetical protein